MLVVNQLIEEKKEQGSNLLERILWLNNHENIAYVIDVNSNKFPYIRFISDIKESLKDGVRIVKDNDPYIRLVDEIDLSHKHKVIRDIAWNALKDIVNIEPQIYMSKERRKMVLSVCKKQGFSESAINKYLKKYWKRGMTKNALLPDYDLCGAKGKERKITDKKRGRPRRNIDLFGIGVNVDDEMKKIFKVALNKFYYSGTKNFLTLAYELMVKEFFSEEIKIENGVKVPVIKQQHEIPTFAQFKYWFYKERNLKKEIISRKSYKKYEQKHRAVLGDSTTEAIGPASIYQIDATIADVYLVSRYNRDWIIGRPVIYSIMDVFSRMIVGIYIGLEGPSWIGAMMALANAATNKIEFCKEYGIEIDEKQWDVKYLPDSILADRGEFEGFSVETLINSLHVKIMNTPPFRADWKGVVEQNFKITNDKVKAFLPGSINKEIRERGDKDYRLDAKLDIYQFTQVIIRCVLYHNNHHYLKNYNRQEMMIEDEVYPIPVKLWEWGIKNRSGKLRYVDEDIVKLSLLPSAKARVTGKGIKFKNLFYGSKVSLKERWFEKARNRGSWTIDVSYDPRDMSFVYIKNESEVGYEKCFLLEHQSRYKNKSYDEINYLLEHEKVQSKKSQHEELQSKVDLIAQIEDIVNEAEAITNEQGNQSNNKKLRNIRANRKFEKILEREERKFELGKEEYKEDAAVIPFRNEVIIYDKEDDEFELLMKKQKEALGKNE